MLLKSQEVCIASLDLSNKGWKMYIGGLNKNTPICRRGIFEVIARRLYDWFGSLILSSDAIKFNLFASRHV